MKTLIIVGVLILIGILVLWIMRRICTAPEGYVVVTKWLDRHARIVKAGPYFRFPGEKEASRLLVRQREVALAIPNIFTHGGLPITVNLRFTMYVDITKMNQGELYYSDREREEQQAKILKATLQEAIAQISKPPPTENPNRIDLALLFSPFFGNAFFALCHELQTRASTSLARHGLMLTEDPLVISSLGLPERIIDAFMDFLQSGFDSAARHEFIRRVRAAAPDMSDAGLVYLLNAIQNSPGEMRTIFTSGMFHPEIFVHDQDVLMPSAPGSYLSRSATTIPGIPGQRLLTSGSSPDAHQTNAQPGERSFPDRALTSEDMALLKRLPD